MAVLAGVHTKTGSYVSQHTLFVVIRFVQYRRCRVHGYRARVGHLSVQTVGTKEAHIRMHLARILARNVTISIYLNTEIL